MSEATWMTRRLLLGLPVRDYLRLHLNPFDLAAALILAVGIPVLVARFAFGLGAVTNLSQTTPWGLWIGFDMLCGVALAAGGYTIAAAVYIFGLDEYKPIVRPAVLTGFLGYVFAVIGLLCDLGQPWRIPYPIFRFYGTTSVMFEVGWCVFLYTSVLALEFAPAFLEWMGWTGLKRRVGQIMIGSIVLGILLSTLHQSSLGSLFLMAPGKLHPLWYSPFIPLFFFVSSIVAGLAMVIVESSISHRAFRDRLGASHAVDLDRLTVGLGRGAAIVLFAYFFLRLQGLAESGRFDLLATGWGAWLMVELVGFVLVPCLLLAHGARTGDAGLVRKAAIPAVLGVVLNRFNVSMIAFQADAAVRYVPSWMEIAGSLAIVTLGVLTFRWIVNRMPVLDARASGAEH